MKLGHSQRSGHTHGKMNENTPSLIDCHEIGLERLKTSFGVKGRVRLTNIVKEVCS